MRLLRRTFTPEQCRQVALAALAVCTLIVFSGAAVRLTGSGLGCPDWPRCEGTRLVPELQVHGLIEFGNRLMTAVVGLPCLLAVWVAWRRRPFRRDLLWIALLLPLGVLGQAVLGGLTVLYGLAPGWVIAHFLLSMALLAACVALVWRASHEPGPPSGDRASVWAVRALLVPGAAALTGGTIVTAAGPHAGGEGTGDVVPRLDWHGAGTLEWAVERHSTTAMVFGAAAVAVWVLLRVRRAGPQAQTATTALCVLLACQGLVGMVQYSLELPAALVWVHVVLATLTWLALLWAVAAVGRPAPRRPAGEPPEAQAETSRSFPVSTS